MNGMRIDRRGNVAILTALLALPLFGLVGVGIDFGSASMARSRLDLAADSAALLATTAASDAFLAGNPDPVGVGKAAAARRFAAQAAAQQGVTVDTVSIAVVHSGTTFTATVTYSGSIQTTLGQLLGVATLGLHGNASASRSLSHYTDIQVLMDVSSSMAIAATSAGIAQLLTLTAAYVATAPTPGNADPGVGCAFACHWTTAGTDYFALARRNNIQLRLDVLQSAVINLSNTIQGLNTGNTFRFGLYTFGQTFNQAFPLSGQIAGANAAIAQIQPDINSCTGNCDDTYFTNAVSNMANLSGTSGSGATQQTAQKYVFIITDGVVDQTVGNQRIISPVNPADCAMLKSQGATVLVLYTTYLPLPTNSFYVGNVEPFQARIGPALQACASAPNLFFQANNTSDVDTELQRLLQAALANSAHLTQ